MASSACSSCAPVARRPCLQQRPPLLAVQFLPYSADLAFPLVCLSHPMVTVAAQKSPRVLVGLQVTSWRKMVVVVNSATVAQQKRVLGLQLLEKSFSQTSMALSGRAGGWADRRQDWGDLDDLGSLGTLVESRRILLCRTSRSVLFTSSARALNLWPF